MILHFQLATLTKAFDAFMSAFERQVIHNNDDGKMFVSPFRMAECGFLVSA